MRILRAAFPAGAKFRDPLVRSRIVIRALALALPLWLALAPSFAAAPASVFLEDLTWPEVRDAVASGKDTILVPVGGTEQNGPHMALGKHNVRARYFAGKIAAALGDAL